MGHPIEYIMLHRVDMHLPNQCTYCGLKFIKKGYINEKTYEALKEGCVCGHITAVTCSNSHLTSSAPFPT